MNKNPTVRIIKDGWVLMTRYAQYESGEYIDLHIYKHTDPKALRQLQFDTAYFDMAKIWASCSRAERKKVACLVVKGNSIIADGINGTPSKFHTNTCEGEDGETTWEVLHAESNAITKLAKSNVSSDGATMYCTFSPCKECSKLILQSGIKRLAYCEEHSDTDGLDLLVSAGVIVDKFDFDMKEWAVGEHPVRIWSNSSQAYWRQTKAGYTSDLAEAGWFSPAEAMRICSKSPEKDEIRFMTK